MPIALDLFRDKGESINISGPLMYAQEPGLGSYACFLVTAMTPEHKTLTKCHNDMLLL